MYIRSLEVSFKHPDQISPVMDLVDRELLEPPTSSVGEEERQLVDDSSIVPSSTSQLACQPEICQPQFWLGFTIVFGDGGRGSEQASSGVLRIVLLKTRGPSGSGIIRSSSLS